MEHIPTLGDSMVCAGDESTIMAGLFLAYRMFHSPDTDSYCDGYIGYQ